MVPASGLQPLKSCSTPVGALCFAELPVAARKRIFQASCLDRVHPKAKNLLQVGDVRNMPPAAPALRMSTQRNSCRKRAGLRCPGIPCVHHKLRLFILQTLNSRRATAVPCSGVFIRLEHAAQHRQHPPHQAAWSQTSFCDEQRFHHLPDQGLQELAGGQRAVHGAVGRV